MIPIFCLFSENVALPWVWYSPSDTTGQVTYTEPPEGAGARMGAKYQWSPDPALAAIIGVVTVIIVLIPIVCSVCFHLQLRTDSQRKKVRGEEEYCHLLSSVVRLMILSSYFKTFNQFPRNFEGRNYEQTLTMQINLLKHSLLSSLGEFYWNKRRIIFFPVIWFKSLPSKQFTRNGWYLFSVFTKHIVYW